ncbi:MAG: ParB N-terminal domain-containing protein [Acidobacteriota bacterium]|nr:ParB N-terminal domain-containing protein [Acidobacteriota bacterium]
MSTNSKSINGNGRKAKSGHVRILPLADIRPSPENEKLYRPVGSDDPQLRELAEAIRLNGFKVPMVVSRDKFILSGHRRYAAAKLVGLKKVPCVVEDIDRITDLDSGWWDVPPYTGVSPEFVHLLEMYNRQRDKTLDEMMRESVVKADPKDAHRVLSEHREARSEEFNADTIELREFKGRAKISEAKFPFLNAVCLILREMNAYWPLSDRQIHYALLNDPPLRHASKPNSRYNNRPENKNKVLNKNNGKHCYKDLCDLLLRMRLEGIIPFSCIDDETRPVSITSCHQHAGLFLRKETDGLFKGYYRDLMQSQPNHIEIMYEKLTGYSFIKSVATQHCIPLTVGRGFSSLPPRHQIAERYRKSGKDKLIILAMSDLDPDGDEIAHCFARSMRDDFSIEHVELIKVALTMDQARERELPVSVLDKAKKSSPNYQKYVEGYGTDNVWELEALSPALQQKLLVSAIDSVIDVDAYNYEVGKEEEEAAFLDEKRQRALLAIEAA